MSRSLSLSAWLALRRGSGDHDTQVAARPDLRPGERLIWVHCPQADRCATLPVIAEALEAEGTNVHFIVTTPDPPPDMARRPGMTVLSAPPEFRVPVRAFLAAIRPEMLIWMQGLLRPVLLSEAGDAGLQRVLVDAEAEALVLDGGAWMPGAAAALVSGLDHALAVDQAAAQRLARLGLSDARVEVAGALEPLPHPPGCNERERRDLAQTIGPRPVWLAAELPMSELDDAIAAHREAARAAHRLLLILAPARAEDVPDMLARLREAGLNTASRWDGAEPDDTTEVYLADGPGEIGLWFRLAPITYLGGTLRGGSTRHPFEAAALGTAILHGTAVGGHGNAYARLARAGAARPVRSGQTLGQAVETLLAPDRCAAMVQAAWEVSTAGAVVANRVAELITARLRQKGG